MDAKKKSLVLHYTYGNTEVPLAVPKNESSKIPIP
jgi:hypothetical protein